MSTFPNSTVQLFSNVKLSNEQNDTFYFGSLTAQSDYFDSLSKVSVLSEQYRVEASKNMIKVEKPYSGVYKCNYMRFKNTSYENKWFYAFITRIEYVNEVTSAIYYQIDYMQTWFFDYQIDDCFVEREHTATDAIGDHFEPERVSLGEYVLNSQPESIGCDYKGVKVDFTQSAIVLVYNQTGSVSGYNYDGSFSTSILKVWKSDEEAGVADFINSVTDMNEIQNIYMCPIAFFTEGIQGGQASYGRNSGRYFTDLLSAVTSEDTLDGYKPRNNKMYTYPYNFYRVDTPDGESLITRYELFKDLTPRFAITTSITMPVEMSCYPIQYKNQQAVIDETSREPITVYRPEKISIKGYPMCNWSTPYYSEWLAQNSVPRQMQFLGGAISTAINAATIPFAASRMGQVMRGTSAIANAGNRIVNDVMGWLADDYSASIHANISHGTFVAGNNDFSCGRMKFEGARVSITAEYARRIDEFFTAYGYAVGRVKKPSRYNRSRFTYVKTIGANVHGNLPVDAADAIASYYDNGIRFWADKANLGSYAADNAPL